jgi:hypothetical protein
MDSQDVQVTPTLSSVRIAQQSAFLHIAVSLVGTNHIAQVHQSPTCQAVNVRLCVGQDNYPDFTSLMAHAHFRGLQIACFHQAVWKQKISFQKEAIAYDCTSEKKLSHPLSQEQAYGKPQEWA